ncbi:HpcH/HpaI aldolase/citrate lyase family protein [Parasalinivibrio latis]|uniref:HpcH/HpaI aldolase family protein n=1 Tax=Parasalinivibrio latis TaxID=2952610 RepID=UPI0030E1E291
MDTLKNKLRARQVLLGMWISIPNTYQLEALASAGFDWLLIDMEHSPTQLGDIVPMLQASKSGNSNIIVRPDSHDPIQIKRLLDMGVTNFLFPYVQTEEEAKCLVQATRYSPEGFRGVAGCTRASEFGRNPDYLANANDEICLIVQVESASAISEIEGIAKIAEIDGIFVGPADLAADMGYLGKPDHPQVRKKVTSALEKIKKAGKANGLLTFNQPFAQECIKSNCQLVGIGGDLSLLVQSSQRLLGNFRPEHSQ